MSNKTLRVTPRSLVAPADLEPFRAAVVELPADETPAALRWLSNADLGRQLRRFRAVTATPARSLEPRSRDSGG